MIFVSKFQICFWWPIKHSAGLKQKHVPLHKHIHVLISMSVWYVVLALILHDAYCVPKWQTFGVSKTCRIKRKIFAMSMCEMFSFASVCACFCWYYVFHICTACRSIQCCIKNRLQVYIKVQLMERFCSHCFCMYVWVSVCYCWYWLFCHKLLNFSTNWSSASVIPNRRRWLISIKYAV